MKSRDLYSDKDIKNEDWAELLSLQGAFITKLQKLGIDTYSWEFGSMCARELFVEARDKYHAARKHLRKANEGALRASMLAKARLSDIQSLQSQVAKLEAQLGTHRTNWEPDGWNYTPSFAPWREGAPVKVERFDTNPTLYVIYSDKYYLTKDFVWRHALETKSEDVTFNTAEEAMTHYEKFVRRCEKFNKEHDFNG